MHFFLSPRCNVRIIRDVLRRCSAVSRSFSSNKSSENIELPPEPTTCCMSGCANCVWIAYAEELSKLYKGNSDKAREIILNKISDPSLKMFLSVELRFIEDRAKDKVEP